MANTLFLQLSGCGALVLDGTKHLQHNRTRIWVGSHEIMKLQWCHEVAMVLQGSG